MTDATVSGLQPLWKKLDIPQEFAQYDTISESETIVRLEDWKRQVYTVLSDVRNVLRQKEALSIQGQAQIISAVAPFDGEGPWAPETTREQAKEILECYACPEVSLLEHVLTFHVKSVFQSNPHPSINLSTGRILARSAGGPLASLDHLEGQTWKTRPGSANIVSWCVRHLEVAAYERLWHLIIPPVMVLLDDHEAPYKLRGIQIVSEMLKKVPADLLRRTGVGVLLFSSLKTCLTYLHNPETPNIIRAAVPTTLSLILLTTSPGSAQRFDQLCALLGDSIIGGIWIYAMRDPDAIEASLDVLPNIVRALEIGTTRYLRAIIPQLVFPLLPASENTCSIGFQLKSLRALSAIIQACACRMHKWKGTILEGLLKRWVTLVDSGANDEEAGKLKRALQEVCDQISDACPSLVDDEFARLLQVDACMFGPLVQKSHRRDG
ncbi:hypothetical protein AcW1_004169 [Taiwanofungus camphoratus]|nr:hypothetical protein AcW2_006818 [Antrodia cinnamomea]KAI0951939.1 hypothetical protein AcV7_007892 [Antrodia cinnamomea]KAI0959310.1 hypothetical protein AcW1_004169 [Antrodia cinnamomea]